MSEKIIKISEDIDEVALNEAEELHKEVLARTYITAGNLLELGKLFKTIRDKKHYKLLGAETFNEYCGFPEISFGRSTIYSFIHTYELYVLELGMIPEVLSKIGHRKLQIIAPVVKDDVYWVVSAKELSESDLINEVRRAQGKPEMIPKPKEKENVYPFTVDDYVTFVRQAPCITCSSPESDAHHFPKTRGAGGRDTDVIPLCRECHSLAHNDPFDFLWMNLKPICDYFFDLAKEAYAVLRRNE